MNRLRRDSDEPPERLNLRHHRVPHCDCNAGHFRHRTGGRAGTAEREWQTRGRGAATGRNAEAGLGARITQRDSCGRFRVLVGEGFCRGARALRQSAGDGRCAAAFSELRAVADCTELRGGRQHRCCHGRVRKDQGDCGVSRGASLRSGRVLEGTGASGTRTSGPRSCRLRERRCR